MVFSINFSLVSNIGVIGDASNFEFRKFKKRFARLTIYNFSKHSHTVRIG